MILEIPKGAYNPCFTGEVACGNRATPVAPASHRRQTHPSLCLLVCDPALGLTGLLPVGCVFLTPRLRDTKPQSDDTPWPLSTIFDRSDKTHIVIADTN